jgi:hypothetical protein
MQSYTLTINAATGEPAVAVSIADQGTTAGNFYLDLTVKNSGPGNATSVNLDQLTFRVLGGSGTVTYNTSLTQPLPISVGSLGAGASVTVRIYLNVGVSVTRFSITENGNLLDSSGSLLTYSSTQLVVY